MTPSERADKIFLDWVRTLPSCLPRLPGDDSPIVAAHIRRASNSGVGKKPIFSAVPLSDLQHRYQHNKGETALVNLCLSAEYSREEAHEIMDKKALEYRLMFLEGAL